jgi:hypothetical protein
MDIKKAINSINIDFDKIVDPAIRGIIIQLLNIIEAQAQEIQLLRAENQELRNEINHLKGEQGRPSIRPQKKGSRNISSENERKGRKKKKFKKSKGKKHKIKVDRIVVCKVDETELPSDAIFKGYKTVLVQDISIQTDNVEFKKELYYSPSLNRIFLAPLPDGYQGEFGPNVKALIVSLHYAYKMTEPAIVELLRDHDLFISAASISRIITDKHDLFHQEKKDIVQAGLPSTIYQQMDDTGARVNGKNYYTHILCNEFYTAYFTRARKDRLTILEILMQGELSFKFDELSYALMEYMGLPNKMLSQLKKQSPNSVVNRQGAGILLSKLFPSLRKNHKNRRIILEACAIAAYQQSPNAISILLTDDAPQFKSITEQLALCWVHDGRHYKKLDPAVPQHRIQLDCFLDQYWAYYHRLLDYKQSPRSSLAKRLSSDFDVLFSLKTGYEQLDDRIEKTRFKKNSLLLVLKYPSIPLHNNTSELGARSQARYRDISFQTKNMKGTKGKDTFMTIVATAKKLGINAFHYILDRISRRLEMPSLASLIGANVGSSP